MKTLNLKNLSWFVVWAMVCMVAFASCSDEEETVDETPVFPELKEINIPAGGNDEISFEANMDWTLTSDAGWCKFVDGEFEESTMSGKAGSQTVQVVVSADGQDYETDAVAQITLKMGNQSQVIYKVTRAKKEYQSLVVTDEEGNTYDETHPLTIKGNLATGEVYTTVKVEVEEGTQIGVEYPEWVILRVNEDEGTYELTFNTESGHNFKYAMEEEGTLKFMTESGDRSVAVPVVYEGMDETSLGVSPSHSNVSVNADGSFALESGKSSTLTSEIISRNDEYEIVAFVQTEGADGEFDYDFSGNGKVDWITVAKNGADVTITASPNETGAVRDAVVMAFPKAVYDEINGNLEASIIETISGGEGDDAYSSTGIASRYTTFVIAYLSQEPVVEQSDVIRFISSGIAMKGTMGSSWDITSWSSMGIEGSPVSVVSSGGNNHYVATVDASVISMIGDGSEPTYLVFEAEGTGSGQEIGELSKVDGVRGVSVNGMYGIPGGVQTVNGWGIVLTSTNPLPTGYTIVVRGTDGTVVASCEVVFNAE